MSFLILILIIGILCLFFFINYLTEHPAIMIVEGIVFGIVFILTLASGNFAWRVVGLGEDGAKHVLLGVFCVFCGMYFILGRIIRKSWYLIGEGLLYMLPIFTLTLYFQAEMVVLIVFFILILLILLIPVVGEVLAVGFFIILLLNGRSEFIRVVDQEIILLAIIVMLFGALYVHLFQLHQWRHHSLLLIVSYCLPLIVLILWFWEEYNGIFLIMGLIFLGELILYGGYPDFSVKFLNTLKFEAEDKDLKELRVYRLLSFLSTKANTFLSSIYVLIRKIPLHKLGKFQFLIPIGLGIIFYILLTEGLYDLFPIFEPIRVGNIVWVYQNYPEGLALTCFVIFGMMAVICLLLSVVWFIIYSYNKGKR